MFLRYLQQTRWLFWTSAFFFVLLNNLLLYPRLGETRGYFSELKNQHLRFESYVLKPNRVLVTSERASSSMIGNIMALLATFDEAAILPPEGTAQANQVIHGLIQLQSALIKSPSSELAAYRMTALAHWSQLQQQESESIRGRRVNR